DPASGAVSAGVCDENLHWLTPFALVGPTAPLLPAASSECPPTLRGATVPKVTSGNGRPAPPRQITQTLLLEAYLEIRPGVDVAKSTVGQGEGERSHLVSTIRTFIAIAAASLAVASLIHRGFLIGGFEDGSAATAEGIIATLMAIGL